MTTVKKGDKVRLTIEGVVSYVDSADITIRGPLNDRHDIEIPMVIVTSLELLPPTEPLRAQAVARTDAADGEVTVWQRHYTDDGSDPKAWRRPGDSVWYDWAGVAQHGKITVLYDGKDNE